MAEDKNLNGSGKTSSGYGLLGLLIALAFCAAANLAAQETSFALDKGSRAVLLDPNGALLEWEGQPLRQGTSSSAGELRYGDKILKLSQPAVVRQKPGKVWFEYRWPEEPNLEVTVEHRLSRDGKARTWSRELEIRSKTKLERDLTLSLDSGLPSLPADTWLPLVNGLGASWGTNRAAIYRFAGTLSQTGAVLALPMISSPSPQQPARQQPGRFMLAADPFFSVAFTPNSLEWTYPARGGLENGRERRTVVVTGHEGSPDASLSAFFATIMAGVPPGPKWLHDIAMVDYDYMSDEGHGWFRDVDALTAALPKRDRHQVLLCLHGWYDFLGRYCFDSQTQKLDQEWTAFSSYEVAKNAPLFGEIGGDRVQMGFTNCKPVKMSLSEVHNRLQYARSRGFRAAMYFADGMNAGEGLPDFEPSRVLRWGGWQGPDSKGKSYFQNPLHPKVREFFVQYTRALLNEFGPDMDALDWDETFHIGPGNLGSDTLPGYADRAMMRLVRDCSAEVEAYNRKHHRQIAFLTSDDLGCFGDNLKAPYALVAHGTYQDSWCRPEAWSWGIFANYRNVLWSCCWWPISKWSWIDFGVRQYQAPVAISNGWGDDKGFSEMTDQQRARALELFKWRKSRPTKLTWLTELPTYQR